MWGVSDYAITSTLIFLDVSKFGDCCSIAHLAFTPIDRLWHDACSLDSMERNAYIRACELSQRCFNQIKKLKKSLGNK